AWSSDTSLWRAFSPKWVSGVSRPLQFARRRSQKPDKNFTLKTSLLIGTLAHRTKRQKSRNLPTTKQQLVLYLSTPAKIFPSGSRQTALPEEKLTKKIYK
ncbi:hypothetical protein, partial [Pseudomonas aeruginosa]|uniref:hypothetical protein n=1 Tax=Pseudomonas aeruginosa TaxID=287 RepID=UPI0026EEA4F2